MVTEYLLDVNPGANLSDFVETLLNALRDTRLGEDGFFEIEYLETETQKVITYAEDTEEIKVKVWSDFETNQRYLELLAPDDATLKILREALQGKLKFVDHNDLVSRVSGTTPSATDLVRLAYSSPLTYQPETANVISSGLSSKSSDTRKAAAFATGILGWREFSRPLENQLNAETSEGAKQAIQSALRLIPAR